MKTTIYYLKGESKQILLKIIIYVIIFSALLVAVAIKDSYVAYVDNISSNIDVYVTVTAPVNKSTHILAGTNGSYLNDFEEFREVISALNEDLNSYYFNYCSRATSVSPFRSVKVVANKINYYFDGNTPVMVDDELQLLRDDEYYLSTWYNNGYDNYMFSDSLSGTSGIYPPSIKFSDSAMKTGRLFTQEEIDNGENVCIVVYNHEFCDLGLSYFEETTTRLQLGDKICITETLRDKRNGNNKAIHLGEYEYTIIGTYEYQYDNLYTANGWENEQCSIYIPQKAYDLMIGQWMKDISTYNPEYLSATASQAPLLAGSAIYSFHTYEDLENFVNKLDHFLPQHYSYGVDVGSYAPILGGLSSLRISFSHIEVTSLIFCLLVSLMVFYSETGHQKKKNCIYLSCGMKKKQLLFIISFDQAMVIMASMLISFISFLLYQDKLIQLMNGLLIGEDSMVNNSVYFSNLLTSETVMKTVIYGLIMVFTFTVMSVVSLHKTNVSEVLRGE